MKSGCILHRDPAAFYILLTYLLWQHAILTPGTKRPHHRGLKVQNLPRHQILTSLLTNVLSDDRGLGAVVAEKFAAEGTNVAINYVSNVERAKETAAKVEKDYGVKAIIIQGVRNPQWQHAKLPPNMHQGKVA